MRPVRLIVYSDYLCPWCYNATVRLRRIEEEFGSDVELVWKTFLLRPEANHGRDLERFRAYTRSWQRPAAETDSGVFRVWQGEAGPPSHSVPPHVAAKAAAALGEDAFHRLHDALLYAYFADNRDIADHATLAQIWQEQGLPAAEFARVRDPELVRATLDEDAEARRLGVTGVPSARLEGNDAFVTGALPLETYRRWIQRALDAP